MDKEKTKDTRIKFSQHDSDRIRAAAEKIGIEPDVFREEFINDIENRAQLIGLTQEDQIAFKNITTAEKVMTGGILTWVQNKNVLMENIRKNEFDPKLKERDTTIVNQNKLIEDLNEENAVLKDRLNEAEQRIKELTVENVDLRQNKESLDTVLEYIKKQTDKDQKIE